MVSAETDELKSQYKILFYWFMYCHIQTQTTIQIEKVRTI